MKYDQGKTRYDLLIWSFVEGVAKILTFGAEKYAPNSWQHLESGTDRYFAACIRHLIAWRNGETLDPESGLPHLYHAACNLMFLNWLDHTEDKSCTLQS